MDSLSEHMYDTISETRVEEVVDASPSPAPAPAPEPVEIDDTPVDLLGGALPEVSTSTAINVKGSSTVDLLSEIFCGVSLASSSTTTDLPGLNVQRPTPGPLLNNLKRNTSTPNLTKVNQPTSVKLDDPLADLVSPFMTSTCKSTSSSMNAAAAAARKLTGGSQVTPQTSSSRPLSPLKPIPVASANKMSHISSSTNANGSLSKDKFVAPKQPHYSRSFFKDAEAPTASTGTTCAGINPKVAPNQFEDLLTGFTKSSQLDTSGMTIAQMRKADLVS